MPGGLSAVRGLFRYLARHHGVLNPAPGLLGTPRVRPPSPRALSPAQAKEAAAPDGGADDPPCRPRDAALFTLLYGCGLRISEALGLDVRDAPRAGTPLRVLGKGGKERVVPVLPAVADAVSAWLRLHPDRQPAAPLFPGREGRPAEPRRGAAHACASGGGWPGCRNTRRRTRCGIRSRPICWRPGGDLRSIQELLGHASLSTTQRYTAVDQAQLLRVWRQSHPGQGLEAAGSDGEPETYRRLRS